MNEFFSNQETYSSPASRLIRGAEDVVYASHRRPPERSIEKELRSGLPLYLDGIHPVLPESNSRRRAHLCAKRVVDVIVGGAALLFLAPLLIVVSIMVKVSSRGPILFRQSREGIDGTLFTAYKFRSMYIEVEDPTGVSHTVQNDVRITSIGRFLRRSSIDELPQLLNVMRGEMSLVGPRPHVLGMMAGGRLYCELVPYYSSRLGMLPGITGWAQANGLRGAADEPSQAIARIDHDIAYIQNFSIWLDLKIMCLTVMREFITGTGG